MDGSSRKKENHRSPCGIHKKEGKSRNSRAGLSVWKEQDTNDIGGTYVEISIQDAEMWCYRWCGRGGYARSNG